MGLNAATGDGDLVRADVIDPVKVTRSALRNAESIASMVLTTDTLVVEGGRGPPPVGAVTATATDRHLPHHLVCRAHLPVSGGY